MKKVLITGGTGFIGANLARRLAGDGDEVHLLVRSRAQRWRITRASKDFIFHSGDVGHAKSVEAAFKKIKPDWVFHLAAFGAYSHQTDVWKMVATNIQGMKNLVALAARYDVSSFVNVGSSSEYGFKDHAPVENEPAEPNSYYAYTKWFATMFGQYCSRHQKLNIVTLRPYSVYGPYEEPTRLIPKLLTLGLHGRLPPLVSPNVARDFVYVDDFVEACLLAARKVRGDGKIYNVCSATQYSIRDIVELVREELGIQIKPRWGSMPNRSWDTNVWVGNNRLIKRELGWLPRTSLKEGLRKTVNWLRGDPKMVEFYKQRINTDYKGF